MFVDAGFTDVRIWHQPCNWYYANGEDYWNGCSIMVPEEKRDDAIKSEMIRMFEEIKQDMQIFDKVMILVHKN